MSPKEQKIVFHIDVSGFGERVLQRILYHQHYETEGGSIHYANTGRPSKHMGHVNLGRSFLRFNFHKHVTRKLNRLRKELDETQADFLIVSDQNIGRIPPEILKMTIERVFEPSEYLIVKCYASHLTRFLNQYLQNLFGSYGKPEPLDLMQDEQDQGNNQLQDLNYWQETFGSSLRFIRFSDAATSADLATDFLSTVCDGTNITARPTVAGVNVFKTNTAYVEAARILMGTFSEFPEAPAAAAGFYVKALLDELQLSEYKSAPVFSLTKQEAELLYTTRIQEAREMDHFFGEPFFETSLDRVRETAAESRPGYLSAESRTYFEVLSAGLISHFRPPVMKYF